MIDNEWPTCNLSNDNNKVSCFTIPFFSKWYNKIISFRTFTSPTFIFHDTDREDKYDFHASIGDKIYDAVDITLTEADDSFSKTNDCDFDDDTDHVALQKYQLSDFDRHRILGAGQFGEVWLVSTKYQLPPKVYAMKVLSKFDLITTNSVNDVINEKRIMQTLQYHPFIVHLEGTFQTEHCLFLLQEFCQGGELLSLMNNNSTNTCLSENQSMFYTYCIASALEYMHSVHQIVYRDLKPENIVFDSNGYPKLIDMGYAKVLSADQDYVTYTFCGTPNYVAPEMIVSSGTSFGVDHWALGILVHEMLLGCHPFYVDGMDQMELFDCICENDCIVSSKTISNDACALISALLMKVPSQRLGRSFTGGISILDHNWFLHLGQKSTNVLQPKINVQVPWIPDVKNNLDDHLFDDSTEYNTDRLSQSYPKLTKREAALFDSF